MKIHKISRNWDLSQNDYWIGGNFSVPNQSNGYHGILKQWWDHYKLNPSTWLLVSETNNIKEYFSKLYPNDDFFTLEYYTDNKNVDYNYDLCNRKFPAIEQKIDLILCQATLEHLYDPFTAVLNMENILSPGGTILIHTHNPEMQYHAYPRDYIRYFSDWFIDLPKYIQNIEMVEFFEKSSHSFVAYKKNKG